MGVRYGNLSAASGLENLPPAARSLVRTSVGLFRSADRGLVRNSNDKTVDHRTSRFRDWLCDPCGYRDVGQLAHLRESEIILLLGAFLDFVASEPYDAKGSLRRANTVSHYLQDAAAFLRTFVLLPFSIYLDTGSSRQLHPMLRARIDQLRKWRPPRDKREPFTHAILTTLYQQQAKLRLLHDNRNLTLVPLVFDVVRLGIFAGFRSAEYAQSKGKVGTVSRVPLPPANLSSPAPAVALIAADFEFLNRDMVVVPHKQLFRDPSKAAQLNLRFRHDKSGKNYAIRKFGPGSDWTCPILAAISILGRADILAIQPQDPVCAFRSPTGATRFLRGQDVTDVMRQMVIQTYPDPAHTLRSNIHRFASHSLRVTAAVALHRQHVSITDIAHRLRWQPESVQHYLRECSHDLDEFTATTIAGAMRA